MKCMIFVCSCLLGDKTKYNGSSNANDLLMDYNFYGCFLSGCPECSGKLPIPRPIMEIQGGTSEDVLQGKASIVNVEGQDVTKNVISGCKTLLDVVKGYGVKYAFLKDGSPTCGVREVNDGTFSRTKIPGCGVFAQLLKHNGIKLYSERDVSVRLLEQLIAEDQKG